LLAADVPSTERRSTSLYASITPAKKFFAGRMPIPNSNQDQGKTSLFLSFSMSYQLSTLKRWDTNDFAQKIVFQPPLVNYLCAGFLTGLSTATKYNGLAVGIAL
jgi:hypothetical protein